MVVKKGPRKLVTGKKWMNIIACKESKFWIFFKRHLIWLQFKIRLTPHFKHSLKIYATIYSPCNEIRLGIDHFHHNFPRSNIPLETIWRVEFRKSSPFISLDSVQRNSHHKTDSFDTIAMDIRSSVRLPQIQMIVIVNCSSVKNSDSAGFGFIWQKKKQW